MMDGIFFRADLELFEEAVIQRPKPGPTTFTQHRGTVAALTIVADGRAGGLRLRVIQGNEERENLDLSLYIRGANAARARGIQDFSEDMPIYGCVDEPKSRLALRYHLAQGLIRITRLRFKQTDQCSLLAQIIKDRGMPLRPMNGPPERPMTAPDNMRARHSTSSSVTVVGNTVPPHGALNNARVLDEQRSSQASLDYFSAQDYPSFSTGSGMPQSRPAFMPADFPTSSDISLPRLRSAPQDMPPETTVPQRPSTSAFSSLALPDLPRPTPVTARSLTSRPSLPMADQSQRTNHYGQGLLSGNASRLDTGQQDVSMDDYSLPPSAQYRREESGLSSALPPKHARDQALRNSSPQGVRDGTRDERRDSVLAGDYGLRAYAEQSQEERRAALDDYLVEKLDDPNFVKLCEDLETCWRARLYGQR